MAEFNDGGIPVGCVMAFNTGEPIKIAPPPWPTVDLTITDLPPGITDVTITPNIPAD